MFDYNKGTVTLQCRQEYQMSSATTVAKTVECSDVTPLKFC